MGVPKDLAGLFAENALFPQLDPRSLTLQYAVPDDITDVGIRPTYLHHAVVQAMYGKLDLALLHVTGAVPAHRIAQLADQAPAEGEQVSLVGNTNLQWFSYKQTVVSALRHSLTPAGFETQGPFIQIMNGMNHGDSGGGLFNDRGQLVGIAEAVDPETGFGICIHLDNLRAVLIGQHLIKAELNTTQVTDPDLGDASLDTENL